MQHNDALHILTSNNPKIKPLDFEVIKFSEESASELVS